MCFRNSTKPNASGPVPPFELGVLSQKGSLYVTRPTLNTYAAKRELMTAETPARDDMGAALGQFDGRLDEAGEVGVHGPGRRLLTRRPVAAAVVAVACAGAAVAVAQQWLREL